MTNAVEAARATYRALKAATPDCLSPERAAHDEKVIAAWEAFVRAKDDELTEAAQGLCETYEAWMGLSYLGVPDAASYIYAAGEDRVVVIEDYRGCGQTALTMTIEEAQAHLDSFKRERKGWKAQARYPDGARVVKGQYRRK